MKISLTMPLIKSLSVELKPVTVDGGGKVVFESNPLAKDYIVWDTSQDAPPGFGVRVARKKTFVIRRKFNGKSIMASLGNVADYVGEKSPLSKARSDAAAIVLKMRETGKNPNAEARKQSADQMTLGQVFVLYRTHVLTRAQKPGKPQTLKAIDTDIRKFEKCNWLSRKLLDFSLEEIERKFNEARERAPSANERMFNFAITAVNWCIKQEALRASVQKRAPLITANPFQVLRINRMFRSRDQLEALRQAQGKRNPLTPSETFGEFLEAAWGRKNVNDNETGVHYLILQLVLGCRGSEHAKCQWGEQLTSSERLVTSHIMLSSDGWEGSYAFFYDTKNGLNLKLPLGPLTVELLRRRRASSAEEAMRRGVGAKSRKFAFPSRNRTSKTGHYSDSTSLLRTIREEAGIAALTGHDLRRSFGSMMASLHVPVGVRKSLFNHAKSDVTDLYTDEEWKILEYWVVKIEEGIFSKAPNVYNSLKPTSWAMLSPREPHVPRPALPRTGRPAKARNFEQA
jgi:integrase